MLFEEMQFKNKMEDATDAEENFKIMGKLQDYGLDLEHKNGDSSNNKPFNCQVLGVPCHRRKHAQ
jgi:hypothetical protein